MQHRRQTVHVHRLQRLDGRLYYFVARSVVEQEQLNLVQKVQEIILSRSLEQLEQALVQAALERVDYLHRLRIQPELQQGNIARNKPGIKRIHIIRKELLQNKLGSKHKVIRIRERV